MSYLKLFRMPNAVKIMGRSSSITNSFVNGIIPVIHPSESQVRQALEILGMDRASFRCSYCGDAASEWDHLRPLVKDQKPTGYISEIQNLVPACGKCNQSKGNKDWRRWIMSDAPKSPKARGIRQFDRYIEKLDQYSQWMTPTKVDFEQLVGEEMWAQHWALWKETLDAMRRADAHARGIREKVAASLPVDPSQA